MNKDLNARLKQVRKLLKLSQKDFALKLSMQQGSLSDIERMRIGVSTKVVDSLTAKFQVNPVWIHTGAGEIFKGKNFKVQGDNTGGNKGDDSNKWLFEFFDDLRKEKPDLSKFLLSMETLNNGLHLEWEEIYMKHLNSFMSELYTLNAKNYPSFKEKAIKHIESYQKFMKPINPVFEALKKFVREDFPKIAEK